MSNFGSVSVPIDATVEPGGAVVVDDGRDWRGRHASAEVCVTTKRTHATTTNPDPWRPKWCTGPGPSRTQVPRGVLGSNLRAAQPALYADPETGFLMLAGIPDATITAVGRATLGEPHGELPDIREMN